MFNSLKYLQIPYKHLGRDFSGCDCFGIIRLFYQEELKIDLQDFTAYSENWAKEGHNYFLDLYKNYKFKKTSKPKLGDIVLIKEDGNVKHCGVILDNEYFLHTLKNGTAVHRYVVPPYLTKVYCFLTYRGK